MYNISSLKKFIMNNSYIDDDDSSVVSFVLYYASQFFNLP